MIIYKRFKIIEDDIGFFFIFESVAMRKGSDSSNIVHRRALHPEGNRNTASTATEATTNSGHCATIGEALPGDN